MKRVIKEEFPYVIFLLLIFLTVTVLSVFLIRGEYRRNLLLTEYEAEKIATALLESFMENRALEPASLSEDITCFGIYDYSGKAIRAVGSAPAYLRLPTGENKSISFSYNRVNQTLTLIRRIGFLPERMRMLPMPMMHLRTSPPQFLLLRLKTRDYWVKQSFYRFSMIVVPLLIAGIVLFVGYLYKKNRTYRKNIESQKQLVQLGEIARTLSHEIKNPLSAIRIQTGILKRVLPEDKVNELTVIEEEVKRLNLLTEKIGDFLRDPQGNPEIIDIEQFLNNLLPRFEREVEFQSTGAGGVLISFDRERLRSVLENLIKNGLESGGKNAEVKVVLSCTKTGIEIIVLDRGEGIAPEMGEKVFDPFFTSKMKGSGIGLSISRRFVEAAAGSLKLVPRKGGGTEAIVSLKRVRE
jgi:two-component system sensor histidine kinase HydH